MKRLIPAIASILFLVTCSGPEVSISEFRGPERSGVYPDVNLLKSWSDSGLTEVFYIEGIGNGYGSPVFTEDRFFVTGETDSMAIIYAYDLDGNQIWQSQLAKEWVKSFPGSRSAPTVAGDLVYTGNGLGDLFCLDAASGEVRWSKDYDEAFGGVLPYHGYAEAPTVYGDKVFWTPGGKEYNVVALDRFSGELAWSSKGFGESMAYNPGKVIVHNERPIFITFSSYHLMGLDAATGELLWSHEQTNLPDSARKPGYGDTHSNTPLYDGTNLYYAEGDGNGGVKLRLSDNGETITEVWQNPRFDSYMGGIVMLDDYLYGCGTRAKDLRSIHAETGELVDSVAVGSGVVIAADRMLYYYTMRGEMMLFSYNEGKLREISRFRVTKGTREHFSHPVIHQGILYVRRGNSIIGYDIRA